MFAPLPQLTIETGGKTLNISVERTASTPSASTLIQTDQVTINGKVFTTSFDSTGVVPVVTRTSHAGRQTVTELDDMTRAARRRSKWSTTWAYSRCT